MCIRDRWSYADRVNPIFNALGHLLSQYNIVYHTDTNIKIPLKKNWTWRGNESIGVLADFQWKSASTVGDKWDTYSCAPSKYFIIALLMNSAFDRESSYNFFSHCSTKSFFSGTMIGLYTFALYLFFTAEDVSRMLFWFLSQIDIFCCI